jgi:hypothetical protein
METQINTYQGMNKDTAYDSIEASLYIDAKDIRITTTNGESIGGFTNIKGNKESFSIPLGGTFPSDPPQIWTAVNPAIIGYTTIRNKIILFVADDSDTKGWIYEVEYDPATREILPGFPQLKYYSSSLNFKKEWPIEALGRYESDCIQRVYWTDYNNYFRSINLQEAGLPDIPVGQIDIFPNVEYTQPLLKTISGGGALLSGEYQISYRLITLDGKETLIAPPSNLIHITTPSETLIQSAQYTGDLTAVNTGKSISIEVDTSNYGDFDKIEFIAIYHSGQNSTPIVTSVEQVGIGSSTTVTFIYTGTEGTIFPVELFTFTTKNYAFKTPKTITQKDNSLVIANIKGSNIAVKDLLTTGTFDAKTRRYRNNGVDPIAPPFPPTSSVNNLKNAFNDEYNSDAHWRRDWNLNSQYRYQSDGLRLGGEGPNISYTFHLEPYTMDGSATPGFANVANIPDFVYTHNLNDGYGTYANTTFPNHASPFISGLLRGYKRGETYRFGIVFYTVKGEATFVEYIGDIKFPDISEEDSVNNSSTTKFFPLSQTGTPPTVTLGYSLGIQFIIDLSTCPELLSQITGYQIVRVQRTEADRRRLTQGIYKGFYLNPVTSPVSSFDFDLQVNGNGNVLHLYPKYPLTFEDNGCFSTLSGTDATTPRYIPQYLDYKILGEYLGFYSPEISFDYNNTRDIARNLSNNPCLLLTGAYGIKDINSPSPIDLSGIDLGEFDYDYRVTLRSTVPVTFNSIHNIKKWDSINLITMEDTSDYKQKVTGIIDSTYYMRNYWCLDNWISATVDFTINPNDPMGSPPVSGITQFYKAGTSLIGKLDRLQIDPLTGGALPANSIASMPYFMTPYNGSDGNGNPYILIRNITTGIPINAGATPSYDNAYPILDLLLPKKEVYGGSSQDALEANIFIPASPFISSSNLVGLSDTFIVFGGDIFINMFTLQPGMTEFTENFYKNNNRYQQNNSVTEVYPIESSINIDLTAGSTIKTEVRYDYNTNDYTLFRQEVNNTFIGYAQSNTMYSYNTVYSRENQDVTFFVQPEGANTGCNMNDIRAYLSNVKINGETIDSWTKFGLNNYYDIDDYGPINKILNYKDTVFFIQDKAVGIYAINRAAITTTEDGVPTQLGTGAGFGKHQYFSKENGSIHQYGVKPTPTGIYMFDAIHRKIFLLQTSGSQSQTQNDAISELKGMHSYIQALPDGVFLRKENGGDNPILKRGITIGKDKINDEILFTFLGTGNYVLLNINTTYTVGIIVLEPLSGLYYIVTTEFTSGETKPQAVLDLLANSSVVSEEDNFRNDTLVFDELMTSFSSRYSATPTIYIENGDILQSSDPNNSALVYTHNIGNYGEFYGNTEECYLTMVINPQADINKILRTLEFNSIVRNDNKVIDRTKTITAFKITTEYQSTNKVLYSSGRIKRKFDKWRVKIPRNQLSVSRQDRLRSTHFVLTLYFDNLENKQIIVNRLLSYVDYQIF